MKLTERWQAALDELQAQHRYRTLHAPAGIDFASNDYLGYGSGARGVQPLSADGLARGGLASRLLRGQHPIWDELESELARWHGAESALVLSSGYMANLGLLSTVIEAHDWVASDELNHASIIDGLRLTRAEKFIFRHQDLDHLEAGLRTAARDRPHDRRLFVVTEALFGMQGDRTRLAELVRLTGKFDAHLIVDEAHSTGCFGPHGSGRVDEAGLRGDVLATVHTGGKALGVPGAYVCGSVQLRELLVNRCRQLIFTTALPPRIGAWWLDAVQRAQRDDAGRVALHSRAADFRAALARHGVETVGTDYVVPIVLGDDALAVAVAERLQQAGWDIRAIRPPSVPEGSARLRVSIHADHTTEQIAAAANAVARELAQCPTS